MRPTTWRTRVKTALSMLLTVGCGGAIVLLLTDDFFARLIPGLAIWVLILAIGLHFGLRGMGRTWRAARRRWRGRVRAPSWASWLWAVAKIGGKALCALFLLFLVLDCCYGMARTDICAKCAVHRFKGHWPWSGATLRPTPYTLLLGQCRAMADHDWVLCHGTGGFLGPMCVLGWGRSLLPLPLRDEEVGFLFYLDCQIPDLQQRLRDYLADPESTASQNFQEKMESEYMIWQVRKAQNAKCKIVWEEPPTGDALGSSAEGDGP